MNDVKNPEVLTDFPVGLMAFLKELAVLPAPSGREDRRAAFCLKYLKDHGVRQAYIDEVGNVCIPFGKTETDPLTVIMAHSDVVFPDESLLPLREDDEWLYCPGISDNTVHIAALVYYAILLSEETAGDREAASGTYDGKPSAKNAGRFSEEALLFVINVGEEGLGNLKGSKAIAAKYGSRVRRFVTFDSVTPEVVVKAVGSARWRVTIETEGGHSYRDYGKPNANVLLARLITKLEDAMTGRQSATWNVGTIEGGTSVNAIAQKASMLFECRSDDGAVLESMRRLFDGTTSSFIKETNERLAETGRENERVQIRTELIGLRPGMGDVDPVRQDDLAKRAEAVIRRYYGEEPVRTSGSTDANAFLSKGIPGISFGLCRGYGTHTREEKLFKASLLPGLKAGWAFLTELMPRR